MPLATSRTVSSPSTTVSSKLSVKLPDSPHEEGPGPSGTATVLVARIAVSKGCVGSTTVIGIPCLFANALDVSLPPKPLVTTVLKRFDLEENGSKEGTSESGVCRFVRVVNGIVARSDGSGPVTVG